MENGITYKNAGYADLHNHLFFYLETSMKNWFKGHNSWYAMILDPVTNKLSTERPKFRIKPIFKWFDIWVGVFVDQKSRVLYIFPLPMLGFKIGYQYSKNVNE